MNIQTKSPCKLVLHCGAHTVDRSALAEVPTPPATETWTPIPHTALLDIVEATLDSSGLEIRSQVSALSRDGNRYFGMIEVQKPGCISSDYTTIVGLRNSHDKSFLVGLVAGAKVFVCDNLSFSGEIRLARKHTPNVYQDIPQMVGRSIEKLLDLWGIQSRRIDSYKNTAVQDVSAHDLILRAVDAGACNNRMIPSVIREWRKPSHPEFEARNAWSLFNAFTEALKPTNLLELPRRTEALHALFDKHVDLPWDN